MTTTIPAGWKLLAKKTCYVLMHDGAVIATLAGPESKENAAIIARMLDAPSCPTCNDQGAVGNILTAQPCPDCAAPGVSTVEDAQPWPSGLLDRVKAAEKRIRDGHGLMRVPADPTDPDLVLAEIAALIEGRKPPFWLRPAPAAGDALDAARLDWLEQHDGRFFNKDRISSIVGTGFLVAGDEQGVRHQTVRAAIDAAIAAQRKGDA